MSRRQLLSVDVPASERFYRVWLAASLFVDACVVLLLIFLPAAGLTAQEAKSETKGESAKVEKEKEEEPIHAIVGGTVFPVSGSAIHRGTVLFQKGKILEVRSEIPIPEGAVVHSAQGHYVTPGLVAVEGSIRNARYSGGNFADYLDPYHRDLHILLASGITTLQVLPRSGLLRLSSANAGSPSTAIIKSTWKDLDGMLVKEPSAIYLSFRNSMMSIYDLRKQFEKAKEHLQKVEEASKTNQKPPKMPRGLKRYVDILKGDLPTICYVNEPDAIRVLLDLRRGYDFDLVLAGAEDGWKLTSELTALNVPVLLQPRGPDFNFDMDSPIFEEGQMIPIRRPAAYAAGGVRVGLLPYQRQVSISGLAGRDLTAYQFQAAFAVRGGMDELTALRAITLEPARILRVGDRVGSLEKGKDADILIWSGHPLHYRSFVVTAWINGKVYYEKEKSRLFRNIPLPD